MEPQLTELGTSSEHDWGVLEKMLADFARLAKSDVPFSQIARELVDFVVKALAATGAALWLPDDIDQLRLEQQVHLDALGDFPDGQNHLHLLLAAVRDGQPVVRSPQPADEQLPAIDYTLLLVPFLLKLDESA